jgi:hypothetical protein
LVIFEIVFPFVARLVCTTIFLFMLPTVAEMIGTYHHAKLFLCYPPDFSLPSCYNYRCELHTQLGLMTFLYANIYNKNLRNTITSRSVKVFNYPSQICDPSLPPNSVFYSTSLCVRCFSLITFPLPSTLICMPLPLPWYITVLDCPRLTHVCNCGFCDQWFCEFHDPHLTTDRK